MTSIADATQRERALDPSRSYIVQAPAGSGKTELLIQRYLKLIGLVEYPEQILAMTFTRKAAGEMKNRILTALENGQSDTPPESAHEKRTWQLARKALECDRKNQWRILDNPSRLKIQTIDSFCRGLAGQMPLLSGLGDPPPTEENAWEFYQETARRTLRLVESKSPEGDAARTLLSHLDNSKSSFLKGTVDLLGKRSQWLTIFFKKQTLGETSKISGQKVLADIIESKLRDARELFPQEVAAALPALASYSAEHLAGEDPRHTTACLTGLKTFPPTTVAHLDQWKGLAWLLTTEKDEYRKPGGVNKNAGFPSDNCETSVTMKEDFKGLLQSLVDRQNGGELRKALQEIKRLPSPYFSDTDWHSLKAIFTLLPKLAAILRTVFSERGKTDFTEITLAALDALGEADDPTDLLLKLDLKLQHILVDEYQDTSFKQHQLLKKLTSGWTGEDGRSLFIVGDPMQSIYRFRDAEVGLFLNARNNGIGDIRLQSLILTTNFRSQKKIVTWVNNCFAEVFPRSDDLVLGAIKHTESQAARPEEDIAGVVLHSVEEPKAGEEADRIVKLIRDIRKTHKTESIAVLARAKVHLRNIIHALQVNDIPFQAEEIYSLDTRPAIMDLLALTQALLLPQDRLSWLSVLRAPWCGLSLADLHRLCHDDASSPIWSLLNDRGRMARLSTDGQRRTGRFIAIMANAMALRFTANPRHLVEGCWIALGGPAYVSETTDTEVFFGKISEMIEEGNANRLQQFEKRLETIYATAGAGKPNAVNIMTMHKAKGLEFDFVILPGLGKSPRTEEKRLLFWIPYGDALLIAPVQKKGGNKSAVYDFLASMDKQKGSLESFRLLYVAATRAKKQLHLLGNAPIHKNGRRKPKANSLLGKLWPYLEHQWPTSSNTAPAADKPCETKAAPSIKRLPADFKGVPAAAQMAEQPDIEFIWAGNQARCLGTVLHAVFQDLAGANSRQWIDREKSRPALSSALLGEGLPDKQLDDALASAMRAIENILQDETGRWILQKHTQHQSELPLTGFLEGRYENRIIDRTFIDENDIRWIIDYKTGLHQGTDIEGFFTEEIKRYRKQLGEYETLIRQWGETRPIKKALYYPMHQRLVEISGE